MSSDVFPNNSSEKKESDSNKPNSETKETFTSFYNEVKAIEKRDSVLTSTQQIDRLTRPGSTYFNLNPFDVLQVDYETPLSEIKTKYRRMSILVHPDKNQDDSERAQLSFEAVSKAWKTLENEEGYKRCKEIIEEAKQRVDEIVHQKKKQLKKDGKPQDVPEDQPSQYKHSVYVQTCKLFADLERLRQERNTRDQHEKKRKIQEEEEEKDNKRMQEEWNKNFEESREGRVSSWNNWRKSSKKSKKQSHTGVKPPKVKQEQR